MRGRNEHSCAGGPAALRNSELNGYQTREGAGSLEPGIRPRHWSINLKYYLHRISHHMEWSHPLLDDKSLLSIGWAGLGAKPDFVRQHQHDWSKVSNTIEGEWGKFRSRFGLQRFLEMEHGDRVVVPTWGAFHVYPIVA